MPAISQPPDSDFEATLANLAHAQLRDKAGSLFDHLLGFEVVEVNEDQTHALGVFGFKLGEQILIVPVFYLNGELKCNFMYLPDQDLFLPLKDAWISDLINRRPFQLGHSEARKETELGVVAPDLRSISGSPMSGGDLFQTRMASDLGAVPSLFYRDKPLLSLPVFLEKTAADGTVEIFLQSMANNEELTNIVQSMYALPEVVTQRAVDMSSKRRKVAHTTKRQAPVTDVFQVVEQHDTERVAVLFGTKAASEVFDDADRESLLRGDVVVKDSRRTKQAFYKRGSYALVNPTTPGEYEILRSTGEFAKAWIFPAPKPIGSGVARASLVYLTDDKKAFYEWPLNLWCKLPSADYEDGIKAVEELPSIDIASVGDVGFLVSDKLTASMLFKVVNKVKQSDGIVRLHVNVIGGLPNNRSPQYFNDSTHTSRGWVTSDGDKAFARNAYTDDNSEQQAGFAGRYMQDLSSERTSEPDWSLGHIVITEDNRNLRVIDKTLYASSNTKFVRVQTRESNQNNYTWSDFDPGSLAMFEIGLHKAGFDLFSVSRDNFGAYYVNNAGPFTRERVVLAAIKKSGADEANAKAVVNLKPGERGEWWFKSANLYAPPIPEPAMGFDNYAGVPEQYEMATEAYAPNNDANNQAYLGKGEVEQMAQAAATGQKNVFDTSAIGSLLKTVDNEQLINRYLGDLILGLDRVNRILCIYYWFGDKFRDRYGSENLPELEEHLLGVSNSLGDLIMFLKQRKIDAGSQVDALELKLGAR